MSYHASPVLFVVVTGFCGEIVYINVDDLTITASQLMSFSGPSKFVYIFIIEKSCKFRDLVKFSHGYQ